MTYDEAMPPDLVAPTSPSLALIADMEKDLWKDAVLTRASLMMFWRSILENLGLAGVASLQLGKVRRWFKFESGGVIPDQVNDNSTSIRGEEMSLNVMRTCRSGRP